MGRVSQYRFTSFEEVLARFEAEVARLRRGNGE